MINKMKKLLRNIKSNTNIIIFSQFIIINLLFSCDILLFDGVGYYEEATGDPSQNSNAKAFSLGNKCEGKSIIITSDSCYVICGTVDENICLLKINSELQIIWQKFYDKNNIEEGISLEQTYDKGFILLGDSRINFNDRNILVIRTDSVGNELWSKTYGGAQLDGGESIKQCKDSGFIFTGFCKITEYADIYVVKIDSNGNIVWEKTIDKSGFDVGNDIIETVNNNYVLCGTGNSKGVIIKLDNNGNVICEKDHNEVEEMVSIQFTPDSGYIVIGKDGLIVKYNSKDNLEWSNDLNIRGTSEIYSFKEIKKCINGGYILIGNIFVTPRGASLDISYLYSVKINNSGENIWSKRYGGIDDDYGESVVSKKDSCFILIGTTKTFSSKTSDIYLLNTNANGDI